VPKFTPTTYKMQTLRSIRPPCPIISNQWRAHSAGSSTSTPAPVLPWFVDREPVSQNFTRRPNPPHLPAKSATPPVLPQDAPQSLKELHAQLSQSPHLEPSTLVISQPMTPPPGPPLPHRHPQGRRKRAGTYAGESMYDTPGSIWSWVVMAQV